MSCNTIYSILEISHHSKTANVHNIVFHFKHVIVMSYLMSVVMLFNVQYTEIK